MNAMKLTVRDFRMDNSTRRHGVYLLQLVGAKILPKAGWKAVGWGETMHRDSDGNKYAIMLEKTTPAGIDNMDGDGKEEGTRLWHHMTRDEIALLLK